MEFSPCQAAEETFTSWVCPRSMERLLAGVGEWERMADVL